MGSFCKRPVTVEAVQFTGDNAFEVFDFVGDDVAFNCLEIRSTDKPVIRTPEGPTTVWPMDWIIKGEDGEFHHCGPDTFKKEYKPVSDEDDLATMARKQLVSALHDELAHLGLTYGDTCRLLSRLGFTDDEGENG